MEEEDKSRNLSSESYEANKQVCNGATSDSNDNPSLKKIGAIKFQKKNTIFEDIITEESERSDAESNNSAKNSEVSKKRK